MSSAAQRDSGPAHRARPKGFRVPKTAEVIARFIRRQIQDQRLRPGDALPSETELREQFAVSRPTLREALRILEAQQLVRVARGATGGARYCLPEIGMVAEHTGIYLEAHRATQRDLTEARLTVEPVIIGYIASTRAPRPARTATRLAASSTASPVATWRDFRANTSTSTSSWPSSAPTGPWPCSS